MKATRSEIFLELLVNLAPDGWARWITGLDDVVVKDYIRVPCRWIKSVRAALRMQHRDIFIQVKSHRRGEFIVLNRWELDFNRNVPRSLTAVVAMASEKYRLPVYPVLVNVLRSSRGTVISGSFQSSCLNLQVRPDYRVLNLWEIDEQLAFSKSLAVLLPLAPVMLGGNNERIVKQAAIALEAESEAEELKKLLAIFSTCALGVELVEKIMSLQAEALRASPWADALKREGQQEGALGAVKAFVESKFGHVPESLNAILPSFSAEDLEKLMKPLLEANSLNEFLASIHQAI